ncbi:DUF551 domain-containing protein [Klebsiella pneumoniae]|uniref:DUF551 domain-containing protein n=2 Tax=Klebsiella pneumoniae TaxID=573 RepID=UPI003D6630AA
MCNINDEIRQMARMALAAMDSEPVAFIFKHPAGRLFWSLTDESNKGHDDVIPVYAAPQPAMVAPVCTCPSGDGSLRWPCPVHPGNSPAQSDCCPAQNVVAPAQNQGWIPVSERMPDNTEPVLCIEKRADFGTYGQPFVCWHDGGGWVGKTNYRPIVTHWMPLPAAPQGVIHG